MEVEAATLFYARVFGFCDKAIPMWLGTAFFDRERCEVRSEAAGITRLGGVEAAMLDLLVRRGGVVRYEAARTELWSQREDPPQDSTLAIEVWRLRRKLVLHGIRIMTLRGIGWELVRDDAPERCPVCGAAR